MKNVFIHILFPECAENMAKFARLNLCLISLRDNGSI